MQTDLLDAKRLADLLDYNPVTGILSWRLRDFGMFPNDRAAKIWNTKFAGSPALQCVTAQGYLRGKIFNRNYLAHRVAWALFYGEWPCDLIDHVNGDPADNRIRNLRAASASQNRRNQKLLARNQSGLKGVSWSKYANRWRAQIRAGGKSKHLGYFDTIQEAHAAYCRASAEFHGEFGRVS